MRTLTALIAGMLFGAGLLLSGMTNPANILAFLDLAGHWQPALAFTMAGAAAVAAPAYWLAHRRKQSLLGAKYDWPDRLGIDRRLIAGSAIFGVGWGLSGICPGPALVLLTRPELQSIAFFAGLAVGATATNARRKLAGDSATA